MFYSVKKKSKHSAIIFQYFPISLYITLLPKEIDKVYKWQQQSSPLKPLIIPWHWPASSVGLMPLTTTCFSEADMEGKVDTINCPSLKQDIFFRTRIWLLLSFINTKPLSKRFFESNVYFSNQKIWDFKYFTNVKSIHTVYIQMYTYLDMTKLHKHKTN